jgi:WD40 repeat protein
MVIAESKSIDIPVVFRVFDLQDGTQQLYSMRASNKLCAFSERSRTKVIPIVLFVFNLDMSLYNDTLLVYMNVQNVLCVRNLDDGRTVRTIDTPNKHTTPVTHVVVAADGSCVTYARDGSIKKWNVNNGRYRHSAQAYTTYIQARLCTCSPTAAARV